ncbi:MAG: hypothetical protein GY754_22845 [bacterium]|nr:hypothetical protein [bacterium]
MSSILKQRKVIVTGGPTREWLDPVRFLSNPSSGKMGIALAREAHKRAQETVFIHGPIHSSSLVEVPCRRVPIESTANLLTAVLEELQDNAVLIMSAAPADYTPVEKSPIKMKKTGSELVLTLTRTPDILKNVYDRRTSGTWNNIFVAGFAAETTNVEEYALGKLKNKGLDMICCNDVSREGAGFGTDTNIITIFTGSGSKIELPILSKTEVASRILDQVEAELGGVR